MDSHENPTRYDGESQADYDRRCDYARKSVRSDPVAGPSRYDPDHVMASPVDAERRLAIIDYIIDKWYAAEAVEAGKLYDTRNRRDMVADTRPRRTDESQADYDARITDNGRLVR